MRNDPNKFKEKNVDAYKELDDFLLHRKQDIRYMVSSIELGLHLTNEVLEHDMWIWNDKVLVPNPYLASNRLDIILKDDCGHRDRLHHIKFVIPCVCNIYPDEPHNILR